MTIESRYLAFLIVLFVALLLAIDAMRLLWLGALGGSARRLQRRIRALAGVETAPEGSPAMALLRERRLSSLPLLERWLGRLPRVHDLDRWLAQTGIALKLADAIVAGIVLALFAGLLLRLAGQSVLLASAGALAAGVFWWVWLQHQRTRRLQRMEMQLPDALDLMARSMQAGHSFNSALLLVGEESPAPLAGEFRQVFDEINHGVSPTQALQALTQRLPSADLRFFAVAVLIQTESGGNLAHILSSIAGLIRERQRLQARVQVLAAEGRLSAWILTLLPFVMGMLLTAFNREFIATLWRDPLGLQIVGVSVALMVVGVFWMWRMVNVRV